MAEEAGGVKKIKKRVMFLGDDHGYFQELQTRFNNMYPEYNYTFKIMPLKDPKDPHGYWVDVLKQKKPHLLYVDFTINLNEMYYIGWLVRHESRFKDAAVVAVVDPLAPVTVRDTVFLLGFPLCHVKCGEIHDAVFDAMYIHDRQKTKDPAFATCKMTDDIRISQVVRLHSVSEKGVWFEGDAALAVGDEIEFKSTLYDKVIPSLKYQVKEVSTTELFYDYHCRVGLAYTYVDQVIFDPTIHLIKGKEGEDPLMDENLDEAEKKKLEEEKAKKLEAEKQAWMAQAKEDREIKIIQAQKKLKNWLKNEFDAGDGERVRVLFADKEHTAFRRYNKRFDYHTFDIRAKTFIHDFEMDIMIFHPSFIFFQYEAEVEEPGANTGGDSDDGEGAKPATPAPAAGAKDAKKGAAPEENPALTKNGETSLRTIMACIQKMKDYKPFIVIYSCKIASTALQKEFNYPQIMVYPSPLDFDMCMNMVSIFQKKKEKEAAAAKRGKIGAAAKAAQAKRGFAGPAGGVGGAAGKKEEEETKVIIKAQDYNRGNARLIFQAKLLTANESIVTLDCKRNLPMWTTYSMSIGETEFYITVVPGPDLDKGKAPAAAGKAKGATGYKGLIHCLGEEEKKALRRFINSVFFRKVEEEKKKELEQYKQLNDQKTKERLKKEAEAKKAKEEEENDIDPDAVKGEASKEKAAPAAEKTAEKPAAEKAPAAKKDEKKAA